MAPNRDRRSASRLLNHGGGGGGISSAITPLYRTSARRASSSHANIRMILLLTLRMSSRVGSRHDGFVRPGRAVHTIDIVSNDRALYFGKS
jgi:hypothetical protein